MGACSLFCCKDQGNKFIIKFVICALEQIHLDISQISK